MELQGLSEENKDEKIFVLVEKDYRGNIILVYKKKYHKGTSTIVDFLVAVIIKQYNNSVLSIFQLYYQDTAMDVIWVDGILIIVDDKDLEDTLDKELDWLELDEVKTVSNKHLYPILENDASVDTFAIKDFGLQLMNTS